MFGRGIHNIVHWYYTDPFFPFLSLSFSRFLSLDSCFFTLRANWRSPFSAHSPYTLTPSKKSALAPRALSEGRRRCKENTDTDTRRRKSNHNFAAQSPPLRRGRRDGSGQDQGWRWSFCHGQSWPQRWTQQYREFPGLAFYGAIRARWCVIMAPYRGKAISVRRPALRQARLLLPHPHRHPRFSSCCDGYDMPRTRRFSPLNAASKYHVRDITRLSRPSLRSKSDTWIMPFVRRVSFNCRRIRNLSRYGSEYI